MRKSYEKIIQALNNTDKPLSQYDIARITGYSVDGIRGRISEMNNELGLIIESVRMKNNQVGYYIPDSTLDETDNLDIIVTEHKRKQAKQSVNDYIHMLNEVASSTIPIKETKPTLSDNGESLVILNSDWHYGKKVIDEETGDVTYSTDIANNRLDKLLGENLRDLIYHINENTKLEEIVLLNIGDMIDGESIYHHQFAHLDKFLGEQIESATRQKWKIASSLHEEFNLPVREEFVVGNHGKGHQSWDGITNFDSMIHLNMRIIRDIAGYDSIIIGDKPNAKIRVADVRGHRVLMRHYAPQQTETASAFRTYSGWLDIYNYDAMVTAHFHSPYVTYFQGRPIVRNGCVVGEDEYARELGRTSDPSQVVFGVSDKRIPTYTYFLDLL